MVRFTQAQIRSQVWRGHVRDAWAGGWPAVRGRVEVFGKALALRCALLMGVIAAAPLVLLIVAIRPFLLLRFGTIMSQRLGHFAIDVEAYLCVRDQRKRRQLIVDIIGCPEPVCNRQLQTMWARTLHITPGARLWRVLDRACQIWTGGDAHHVKLYDRRTDYGLVWTSQPHLGFTSKEHQRGREILAELGVPAGRPWICIHNRDAAYLDTALGGRWAYHDYRDFSVQTLLCAAEELSRRGYYVIRVGSIVAEKLVSNNARIIDYASSGLRSDFADIYLGAECYAFISSDSGVSCIPYIFHKPVCYINLSATLIDYLIGREIYPFIIKRLWHRERERFLSLREMFAAGLAGASASNQFDQAGVESICNTPEEIRDLAIEVDERLTDQWRPQSDDEELQQRFWHIFRQHSSSEHLGDMRLRVGASFLRAHVDLLD